MFLKDIRKDDDKKIYKLDLNVTVDTGFQNSELEQTDLTAIPEIEWYYIIPWKLLENNEIKDCYIDLMMLERISDKVFLFNKDGFLEEFDLYKINGQAIPAVVCETYGDYDLYYMKNKPEIGINILREWLEKVTKNKYVVANDLGYILRDEKRYDEAIEAFKISEEEEPGNLWFELFYCLQQAWKHEEAATLERKYRNEGLREYNSDNTLKKAKEKSRDDLWLELFNALDTEGKQEEADMLAEKHWKIELRKNHKWI